jgi:hypothetical protein
MTLKREAVIDMVAGLPKEFTDELNQLKSELFDSNGIPFKSSPETIDEQIQKANRYTQMLQKRNELWTAKLN